MTADRLPFTKLCEIADFSHPDLAPVVRDVCSHKLAEFPPEFPRGAEHRKDWEVAMAARAIRHFGALRPDATILGVAAGTEDTIFYLARHVRQVFATDRYLSTGPWQPVAPISMLLDPAAVAPGEFDPNRLVVQHMDGRRLLYPDDTFDGIFSSGSIEHFGYFEDVAAAAYEMGRVLKPGGVLSLSTEFRLAGPPGGIGAPGITLLFSAEDLQRFIVEASGLEVVGELDPSVSDDTLSTRRDITRVIEDRQARQTGGPDAPMSDATTWDDRPHIVLLHEGYVFTSVHLTLRKTERYPWPENAWAAPGAITLGSILTENRQILQRSSTPPVVPSPAPLAPVHVAAGDLLSQSGALSTQLRAAEFGAAVAQADATALGPLRDEIDASLLDIDKARHDTDAAMSELVSLAVRADRSVEQLAGVPALVCEDGWACSTIALPDGLAFSIVTDPAAPDPVAEAAGAGVNINASLLTLMLDLLSASDTVLDLGAHVGTFSLAAAARGNRVLAVEASPSNVRLLRDSVRRNNFVNLTVVHAAAGNRAGTVEFVDNGPWGQVSKGGDSVTVEVPAVTLSELLVELGWGPVAFVKMDIEGSEIMAIRGMRQILESADAPAILYESNGHTLAMHDTTPEALLAEFEGLGYTSYLIEPGRLVRTSPGNLQPQTIVDYLAVKRLPRGLPGWRVEPVMTFAERVERVLADGGHPNPAHRGYIAAALAQSNDELLANADVASCLERLRRDDDPEVRGAAESSSRVRVGGQVR